MMKKILLTITVATCFVATAHAQLRSHSNAVLGVKAGGTATSLIGADTRFLRYVPGGQGGIFVNLPLARPFSLQPELLYSMKGSKGQAGVSDANTRLSYLEVPVALRASSNGLFAEVGPQVSLLLTAKSDNVEERADVKSAYRPVDLGGLVGVGYQPVLGGLGFGARYSMGFLSVLKDPEGGGKVLDRRNEAYQLYLTYSPSKAPKPKKKQEAR